MQHLLPTWDKGTDKAVCNTGPKEHSIAETLLLTDEHKLPLLHPARNSFCTEKAYLNISRAAHVALPAIPQAAQTSAPES